MAYIGMCGLKGYSFSAVLVINWVSIFCHFAAILVINRYRFLHSGLQFGFFFLEHATFSSRPPTPTFSNPRFAFLYPV